MSVYGNPPPCIPLKTAAAAVGVTREQLKTVLGSRAIVVGGNKLAVRPADLEALFPGTSAGLDVIENAASDPRAHGLEEW